MMLAAAALLTVGVVVFTLVVRSKDLPASVPVSPVQHLEEKKARIDEGLGDLQFEYAAGKLSDEDYRKTKLDLEEDFARMTAEIDELPGKASGPAPPPKETARVCPHCGAIFEQELKFCGECGKPMKGESA